MKRIPILLSMLFGTYKNPAQEQLNADLSAAIKRQREACQRLDKVTRELLDSNTHMMKLAQK